MYFLIGVAIGYFISEGFKVDEDKKHKEELTALQLKLEHEIDQKLYLSNANNMLLAKIKKDYKEQRDVAN
jgi:hypothetical protein